MMNKIGYLPIVFSVFFSPLLQAKQNVCVFDLLGKAGESYKLMEEWALAAKTWGADIKLLAYQKEELADKDFKIYPNPVNEEIYVKGNISNIKTAEIVDLSGKMIYSEKKPFKNKENISVQQLSTGNYLLKLAFIN